MAVEEGTTHTHTPSKSPARCLGGQESRGPGQNTLWMEGPGRGTCTPRACTPPGPQCQYTPIRGHPTLPQGSVRDTAVAHSKGSFLNATHGLSSVPKSPLRRCFCKVPED